MDTLDSSKIILSIVVPVYNQNRYVEQCIKSLYRQDIPISDYEVLVVDDCSTDNSKDIVIGLMSEFPEIKLLSLYENQKLGSARNIGLRNSCGKYVWFIDSDDFIQPNILKQLIGELNSNDIDVLHFDYKVYNNYDNSIIPYRVNYSIEICDGLKFYFDTNELWWQKGIEVWRRIHKKSFLVDNNIFFAEKVMYEDVDFSLKVFAHAKSVKHLDISPYFYRNNPISITKTKVSSTHINYWILLVNRCNELREEFIINKNIDYRFIKIIDDFIKYKIVTIFRFLENIDKNDICFNSILIKNINFITYKKYISLKIFPYLFWLRFKFYIINLVPIRH